MPINSRTETEVGEALTLVAHTKIHPGVEELGAAINLSDDSALDQFQARAKIGDREVTLAAAGSGFTSPVHPIISASGDLTALAANATGRLHLSTRGLDEVALYAACAAAVAATGVLTAAANATGGAQGTGTLTASGNPTGGAYAAGVLTGTTIAAGDTVTIGGIVYTFVATLQMPTSPNQVVVGGTDSDSLDNLIAAINGGPGSMYAYALGTPPHPTVLAAAGAGDTMDVLARTSGAAGDSITTTAVLTAGDFGAATLENGADAATVTIGSITYTFDAELVDEPYHVLVGADADETLDNLEFAINGDTGEGTVYGTGTVAHPLVTAANQGDDTLDIATIDRTGVTIATTDTSDDLAWGAATVQSGVTGDRVTIGDITYIFDATTLIDEPNHVLVGGSASATLDNLIDAINGEDGAGEEGTVYGTGTVANSLVSAAAGDGDTVDLTAATAGKAGNAIPTTVVAAQLSFAAATLTGGKGPTTVTVDLHG
jgi:hypothetical protein